MSHEVDHFARTSANPKKFSRIRRRVVYVCRPDSHINAGVGLYVIRLPEHYGVLSPILHVVPLKLLAHHTATARGTDVDKLRNLAKSVKVE